MNRETKELLAVCGGIYACVAALMVIGISSWMINIRNSGRWGNWYKKILVGDAAVMGEAYRSW